MVELKFLFFGVEIYAVLKNRLVKLMFLGDIVELLLNLVKSIV